MTNSPRQFRPAAALAVAMFTVLSACGSDGAPAAATQPAPTEQPSGDEQPVATESTSETAAAPSTDAAPEPLPVILEASQISSTGDPLPPFENPDADAAIGLIAPVVVGQSFDGTEVSIGGPSDGPTMLVFLAHWCPHCNDEIPQLNILRDSGGMPDDVTVIGISTAIAADRDNYPPSQWTVAKDWTWPMMADSEAFEALTAFGGTGFPFTVMLDSSGAVVARKSGSSSAENISSWISAVLHEA